MHYVRIAEWHRYQHYKDRNPPWIKLHRDLLSSRSWVRLDNDARVLAIASMLLAAATDNRIPLDLIYIQRVAFLEAPPDLLPLANVQFIEIVDENGELVADARDAIAHASDTLAPARPEERQRQRQRQRQRERERESPERESPGACAGKGNGKNKPLANGSGSSAAIEPRGTRLASDWEIPADWLEWARRERPEIEPESEARKFRDHWIAKAGKDARKADWQATWRNWIRKATPSKHYAQHPRSDTSAVGRVRSANQRRGQTFEGER